MHAAIIGAGLAGLACARVIQSRGHQVTVFDKGDEPGGRMGSLRLRSGIRADYGTRSFIVHDERFARQVDSWVERGMVAVWRPGLVAIDEPGSVRPSRFRSTRYVGTPTMNTPIGDLVSRLGDGFEFRGGRTITSIHHGTGHWVVQDDKEESRQFDAVALAVPSPRAVELLGEIPHLHAIASAVPMTASWATTVVFKERLPIEFDAANVLIGGRHEHAGVLAWMNRESSKPGRSGDECWILHAGEEWTREHFHDQADTVGKQMLEAMFTATGTDPAAPVEVHTHLWPHAFPVAPLCDGCLFDDQLMVGACGDWCMGARVEGAYLSGLAMAGRLLGEHSDFLEPCLSGQHHA